MNTYYSNPADLTISHSVHRLDNLATSLPEKLKAIPAEEFSHVPAPGKWSKKQIIGHLVDSAVNNHHRFIRIQYEDNPVISYDQDKWNELSHYHALSDEQLIDFWSMYNRHLAHIARMIPAGALNRPGSLKSGETMPLSFYINDYVAHMEHHLREVLDYE